MAANKLFFCLHVNYPLMPRQHVENTKEFSSENEAKRANKHADKRIIYWPPFWNKVYDK